MTTTKNSNVAHLGLFAALKEAQDMVRAYDTKAQIVGVGYIFTINVIGGFGSKLDSISIDQVNYQSLIIVLLWALSVIPIIFYGLVLLPTRRVAPELLSPPERSHKHVIYISDENPKGIEDYFTDVAGADWMREAAYEHLRVSKLRDLKRVRFVRALCISGISLALIFFLQFGRTLSLFSLS